MSKRLLLLFLASFALELGISFHLFTPDGQTKPIFFVPAPEYIKCISGTFRPLFAQMLFMKGVLECGANASEKMDYLFAIFRASIQLDPELCGAAFFGGVVLPRDQAEIKKGIALLTEAMKLNPGEWRIPYWIGLNYYQLEDFISAADYYKQASLFPRSPIFLKTNLAMLYYDAQNPELALTYFQGLKESIKDESTLELFQDKIDWLKNIIYLEQKVSDFKKAFGKWPTSLNELVDRGILQEIPKDTFGYGYYLDQSISSGSEKYRVRSKF